MKNRSHDRIRLDTVRYMTATAMSVAIGTVLAILSKQLFGNLPIRLDLSVLAVMLMALLFGFPHGTLAAVLIDGEATLKRVRRFPESISLEPENPMYRPMILWGEDMNRARILGKAVAFTSAIR